MLGAAVLLGGLIAVVKGGQVRARVEGHLHQRLGVVGWERGSAGPISQ
jgi:hypothetical protein